METMSVQMLLRLLFKQLDVSKQRSCKPVMFDYPQLFSISIKRGSNRSLLRSRTLVWVRCAEPSSKPFLQCGTGQRSQDVEKERELRTHLGKEEIRQKVELYNSSVTDHLKMTLNPVGSYTGFIKVQMELQRPITVRGPGGPAKSSEDAFYLPKGSINTLHISSSNTAREVIEALLSKFMVVDNPAKFALYKRFCREDQVYVCKLSDGEHPLYLRLLAGPNTDTLSFVLREQQTGEWDAFSIPELQNFVRILDKEESDHLSSLTRRYATYKQKLEEALQGQGKPG
ncbi:UNVERIFIED_CONTAM: hypothetical protein FKN15_056211 [Acipenser sinensis]